MAHMGTCEIDGGTAGEATLAVNSIQVNSAEPECLTFLPLVFAATYSRGRALRLALGLHKASLR